MKKKNLTFISYKDTASFVLDKSYDIIDADIEDEGKKTSIVPTTCFVVCASFIDSQN